ncbi:MAG: hypothetical protein J6X07_00230 [Prevotella sp.]|nr:hypothetical protein [Prevotella sp.]
MNCNIFVFCLLYTIYGGGSKSDGDNQTFATSPLTHNRLYSYNTARNSKNNYGYIDGGIDYQRTFSVEERCQKGRALHLQR